MALAAALTWSLAADATVLFDRSLDELARDADAVVIATPSASQRAFWVRGRIFTEVTVHVDAVVTGHASANTDLRVRLPGGTVGEVGQTVAGAPSLTAGATVVLFLSPPREGDARVIESFAAGVLPMVSTPAGEVRVMPARTEGLTLVPPPSPSPATRFTLPSAGLALPTFVARLREAAR